MTTDPLTAASQRLHKTDHGDPCPFPGRCALVDDGPWGEAALPAIEREAAAARLSRGDEQLRTLSDEDFQDEHERAMREHILSFANEHRCDDLCSGVILVRLQKALRAQSREVRAAAPSDHPSPCRSFVAEDGIRYDCSCGAAAPADGLRALFARYIEAHGEPDQWDPEDEGWCMKHLPTRAEVRAAIKETPDAALAAPDPAPLDVERLARALTAEEALERAALYVLQLSDKDIKPVLGFRLLQALKQDGYIVTTVEAASLVQESMSLAIEEIDQKTAELERALAVVEAARNQHDNAPHHSFAPACAVCYRLREYDKETFVYPDLGMSVNVDGIDPNA